MAIQSCAPPAALFRPAPLTPRPPLCVVLVRRVFPSQILSVTMQTKTFIAMCRLSKAA